MNTQNILKATTIAIGAVILGATPAFAFSIQVPEPSALSIYGAGVAALVISYRLRKRK